MDSQEPPSKLRQRSIGPEKRQGESISTPPASISSTVERQLPRTLYYIAALSVTTSLLFLIWRHSTMRDTLTRLPEAYALCSRSGAQVYTVDEANPRVRCFVVNDSRFIAIGTLGMCHGLNWSSKFVRQAHSLCRNRGCSESVGCFGAFQGGLEE